MTKAKVGDTIVITNRIDLETRYENGDVFKAVRRPPGDKGVTIEREGAMWPVFVYDDEYEVVPEYPCGSFFRSKLSGGVYEVGVRESLEVVKSTQGLPFHVKDIEPYSACPTVENEVEAASSITADDIIGPVVGPPGLFTLNPATDNVNQPNHYTQGKYEVIDMIAELVRGYTKLPYVAYCLGNVIKYIARAPFKHASPIEDLRKAQRYLGYAIKHVEESEGKE